MNIDILGDRFIGMFKEESEGGMVLRLEVDFSSKIKGLKWTVFNKKYQDSDNEVLIYTTHKRNEIYHVLGMEGTITFDDLIKHSKHIIDFNVEVEEKKILLKEKFDELGELFAKNPIEDLRKLRFVFENMALPIPNQETETKPKKTKKEKKKVDDKIELEISVEEPISIE